MSALLILTYAGILKAFALVGFGQQALGVEAVTWWGKQGLWQRMMVYQWRQCDPLDCFLLKQQCVISWCNQEHIVYNMALLLHNMLV